MNRLAPILATLGLLLAACAPDSGDAVEPDPRTTVATVPGESDEATPRAPTVDLRVPQRGFPLHVIRADTGEPVPFARVWAREYFRIPEAVRFVDRVDGGVGMDAWLKSTPPLIGDEQGIVWLRDIDDLVVLAGAGDGLSGMHEVWAHDWPPLTLELHAERDLEIRVLDHRGAPVTGIPVGLYEEADPLDLYAGLLEARTRAPDGLATIQCLTWFGEEVLQSRTHVGIGILTTPRVIEPIDLLAPREEPLELALPPTGSLVVEITEPPSTPVVVEVARYTAGMEPRHTYGYQQQFHQTYDRSMTAVVRDGIARFPHVGLDEEVRIFARSRDGREGFIDHVPGPTTPGQEVRARVELLDKHPVFQGRLLDEAGTPQAYESYRMNLWRKAPGVEGAGYGDWGDEVILMTDADGRFCSVNWDLEYPRRASYVTLLRRPRLDDAPLGAALTLTDPVVVGANDLGDIVVSRPPLLASGRVVDHRGRAAPGAGVKVHEGLPPTETRYPREFVTTVAHDDQEGTFTVHGWGPEGGVLLSAVHPWGRAMTDGVACPRGATDIRLSLMVSGRIRTRVLRDDSLLKGYLAFRYRPSDDASGTLDWRYASEDWDGDELVDLTDIPEGTHTIQVVLDATDEPLLELERVAVLSMQTCRDPRLRTLDLRDRGRAVFLRLRPQGNDRRHLRDLTAWIEVPSEEEVRKVRVSEGEHLTFMLPPDASSVRVGARGYRRRSLNISDPEDLIVLEPGPRFRLIVQQPRLVPKAGFGLVARLHQEGLPRYSPTPFTFSGFADFQLHEPGNYRLELWLQNRNTKELAALSHPDLVPILEQEIVVRDTEEEQVLRLHIPPEAVLQALEELER